jgi:3-dehydroquinate synthase
LQTADPKARIEELARQRGPLYEEVAHITIETGRPNVQSVVQNILTQLAQRGDFPASAVAPDSHPVPLHPT